MKLNVVILKQGDPRWASQRLGTVNGITIGGYGCIVTCMCELATYYGHTILPNEMDDYLTNNQGYADGDLYKNDDFPKEFSNCTFDRVVLCASIPAPLDQIDAYLAADKPVVVEVDFDHNPSDGIQTHFVVIKGKTDDGHYIINDPWFGDEVFFDARYGDPATAILQINFFSGPIPQPIVPIPPTTIPLVVPNYFLSLLNQYLPDLTKEGDVRAFFGNAHDYPNLANEVTADTKTIASLNSQITQLQTPTTTEPVPTPVETPVLSYTQPELLALNFVRFFENKPSLS